MSGTNNTRPEKSPEYVRTMEKVFGGPSDEGWGSAVFYKLVASTDKLESAAKATYTDFVGDKWETYGKEAWLGTWKEVYRRKPGMPNDILYEMRNLEDRDAQSAANMLLDNVDHGDKSEIALITCYDNGEIADLRMYNIGDGEALSGIEIAGRRNNGETTILTFLMD